MCEFKVANPRDEFYPNKKRGPNYRNNNNNEDELLLMEGENSVLESMISPMFSGLNREQEMSAMVSALTHVVAGDATVEGGGGGGGGGSSSSACKRGRDQEQSRPYTDFSVGSSNLGAPLGTFFKFLII